MFTVYLTRTLTRKYCTRPLHSGNIRPMHFVLPRHPRLRLLLKVCSMTSTNPLPKIFASTSKLQSACRSFAPLFSALFNWTFRQHPHLLNSSRFWKFQSHQPWTCIPPSSWNLSREAFLFAPILSEIYSLYRLVHGHSKRTTFFLRTALWNTACVYLWVLPHVDFVGGMTAFFRHMEISDQHWINHIIGLRSTKRIINRNYNTTWHKRKHAV